MEQYNRKVHGEPHKPGDLIWLFNPVVPKLIIKAEIDQFKEGLLKGMQLLVELQKNPELFAPVFTFAGEKPLTVSNKYKLCTYMYVLPVMH